MPETSSDTHRRQLESALQRVRSGQWTPQQAAAILLSGDVDRQPPDRSRGETLDALIARLGSPPKDVLQAWRFQLQAIAHAYETQKGKPFPRFEPVDLSIDACGSLSCDEFRFGHGDASRSPRMHDTRPNLEYLLRRLAETGSHPETGSRTETGLLAETEPEFTAEHSAASEPAGGDPILTAGPSLPARPGQSPLTLRRAGYAAMILCAAVAIAYVLSRTSRDHRSPTIADPLEQRTGGFRGPRDAPSTASGSLAARPLANPGGLASSDVSPGPQTLDLSLASPAGVSDDADPFSLAKLIPVQADFLPSSDRPAPLDAPRNGDRNETSQAADSVGSRDDLGPGDRFDSGAGGAVSDDELPDELPQSTRLSKVTAVQLPPIDDLATGVGEAFDEATAVELWDTVPTNLKLDFPFDVPLAIEDRDGGGWVIRDLRNDVSVASIRTAAAATQLGWINSASESPSASALLHGRLRSADGRMSFLRPQIEADPWPLRLEHPDVRPTWDLRGPLPPRVSRISIAYQLPRDVEVGWIQPLEETDVRRGRAMAVLTPSDGESVALGMRWDIRGGRKLSCRIRFAARLDPAMPWQVVSHSTLLQFSDQLLLQAAAVSRETRRLATVYDGADTLGRRTLRLKQDRVKAHAESLREISSRVAKLQSLIASLEASATVTLAVWVQWPDEQQMILEMTEPSPEVPPDTSRAREDDAGR